MLRQLRPVRKLTSSLPIRGYTLATRLMPFVGSYIPARAFHSTRCAGLPLPIIAFLKVSTALESARTTGRILMTFLPFIFIKNARSSRKMKSADASTPEEKKVEMSNQIRRLRFALYGLPLVSISLLCATIIASLERTPLTGRWRVIVISPEEEEEISKQLAGEGWRNAVTEILARDGPPRIIPESDWRYQWVNKTLKRLEASIPALANVSNEFQPDKFPLPPPTEHPLRPRRRASEYLHVFCDLISDETKSSSAVARAISGSPYSLLVVDKPGAPNAFSYGFGPDGAGGIVVYSGFLDDVLSRDRSTMQPISPVKDTWLNRLFGALFSQPHPGPHSIPTPEQTSELAILLAHELSHLVLSHHLESLSSTTIIIPGAISILTDIVRVIFFPVTMLFGPFVNDALAQLGRVSSSELERIGKACNTMTQEIEADIVSTRILAHAGFDARDAVKFWEDRSTASSECQNTTITHFFQSHSSADTGHPVNEVRLARLRDELAGWSKTRQSSKSIDQGN